MVGVGTIAMGGSLQVEDIDSDPQGSGWGVDINLSCCGEKGPFCALGCCPLWRFFEA